MTTIDKTRTPAPTGASARAEVVTHALTRLIEVPSAGTPGGTVRVALITLDNGMDHTRPSTLGPLGLASLDAAIGRALDAAPDAIAVTGKPFIFAVGADLSQVGAVADRRSAEEFVALGHRVFGRLREAPVPTFAFVNGAAMGGGMELALHCRYRTLAANAAAMSEPEVFLGILPGWGGTQRRAGERRHDRRRERAEPEPHHEAGGRAAAGRGRCGAGRGRLPRAVAGLVSRRT